jgi:hypothetical protein
LRRDVTSAINRRTNMFTLDRVVPWGRSFDEYSRMFTLTSTDLRSKILGCASS